MKKKIFSAICLLLSAVCIFSACRKDNGNGGSDEQTGSAASGDSTASSANDLILPYSNNDSLNPFFAVGTENISLTDLAYDPLFKVKADYTPENVIAEKGDISGTSVTVTLSGARFSDGSSVSPQDVVYSFNKAKASSRYGQLLSNIQSAKASGGAVTFTLFSPDPYVLNALSFPVVKNGTADKTENIPIGSGPYVYRDGVFSKNENYGGSVNIPEIKLYEIENFTYAENALEIGNVNFLFKDMSDSVYRHVSVDSSTVNMNNLVFLGINNSKEVLSSSAVRTAIYYAIDKKDIASSSYQGYATAAPLLFNPAFSELSGITNINFAESANADKAKSILTKTGYNKYAKDGSLTNGSQNLKVSLLVNSENSFRAAAANSIAESLRSIGFSVTVDAVPLDKYNQKIASGDFDLYLGEIKLTENLDLRPFFSEKGSASKGIDFSLRAVTDYDAFCEGSIGLSEFLDSFLNDMPFVPVCYRSGFAAYKKGLKPDFSYSSDHLYAGICRWSLS